MCIFLQHTLSPLFSATWLSVYGVVATSFFVVRFLLCACLVNPPSRMLLAHFSLVFSASEDKQRVLHKLTGFLHRSVNPFQHTWCRLRACRFLNISSIFAICCPLRGERVSFQFVRLRSPRWRSRSSDWFFCGDVPVASSRTPMTLSLSYHESRAEGYSANSPTSTVSSSFVVQCTENGSLFCFQACQPVQRNPIPPMKHISPMIQVGNVFQQYLLPLRMDGYSVDGTLDVDNSLSASSSSVPSWTLNSCRRRHFFVILRRCCFNTFCAR